MDKQQTIDLLKRQLSSGQISKDDLLGIIGDQYQSSPTQVTPQNIILNSVEESHAINIVSIFYGIGAIIALVGVAILVEQNWKEIGFVGRILVTLGLSLVTYISGILLSNSTHSKLSQVMFTISAVLAPLSVYVMLEEGNIDFTRLIQFYSAIVLSIIYGFAYFVSKKNILVLITVWFGSWAYYSIIYEILGNQNYNSDLLQWTSLILGVVYVLIATGFKSTGNQNDIAEVKEKTSIANVLYGFGTLLVLGAGISIGGIFDLLFIVVIFFAFYGSVFLKSRAMLIFSSLFLMAHIGKITSKYFADSIGWPVALIVTGFLVIGVGYMSYNLNKKYISS